MDKPTTHIALELKLARVVRAILGKLPHDEVREVLAAYDSSPGVNVTTPAPETKPELVEENDG